MDKVLSPVGHYQNLHTLSNHNVLWSILLFQRSSFPVPINLCVRRRESPWNHPKCPAECPSHPQVQIPVSDQFQTMCETPWMTRAYFNRFTPCKWSKVFTSVSQNIEEEFRVPESCLISESYAFCLLFCVSEGLGTSSLNHKLVYSTEISDIKWSLQYKTR